jgi:hypothetical protein
MHRRRAAGAQVNGVAIPAAIHQTIDGAGLVRVEIEIPGFELVCADDLDHACNDKPLSI